MIKRFKQLTPLAIGLSIVLGMGGLLGMSQASALVQSSFYDHNTAFQSDLPSPISADNSTLDLDTIQQDYRAQTLQLFNFGKKNNQASTSQSLSALDTAKRDPNLSILVEAINASGLAGALNFAGDDYVIFAPSNAAFYTLFKETNLTKQSLLTNKSLLKGLLGYHVVKNQSGQLKVGRLTTFNKRQLVVTPQNTVVDTRGRAARIIKPNITTKNGSIYVIDRVLVPKK